MNSRSLGLVAALAVVVALVAGVAVLASGSGPAAFKVGNREVSQRDVDDELAVLHDNPVVASSIIGQQVAPFGEGSISPSVTAGWLQIRIIAEFAGGDLARRDERVTGTDRAAVGLPTDATFKALPSDFRNTLVGSIARVRALQRVLLESGGDDLTATALKACPSGRFVSHILVATEAEAVALKAQLDAGSDFAKLAQANSTDGSAVDGGQLGCLDSSQFVEPFATVAKTQPLGVVSDPVQTQYGFHLILVTDQPGSSDLQAATIAKIVAAARKTGVTIDARYGRWDKKNGQVLPPAVPTG
jgi:peptidyl-prolyl cis-trans isomerase C